MAEILPVGKIPQELLAKLLARLPGEDPRVLVGPGIGLDCAVVAADDRLWVFKSDPVTFAAEEIGYYAVQVNANDIATTGAVPRWFLVTLLLPERKTLPSLVEEIFGQICSVSRRIGVTVIGGHSEVTHGLSRPVVAGTMIGEVEKEALVTPRGANPGDRILLTKGVPIEGAAILAREFPERLRGQLTPEELRRARNFLHEPGIGVLRDARIALAAGKVTAMHDPTEGGVITALWELAEASGRSLLCDPAAVPVPPLAARICATFGLDPLACIASGALLLTAPAVAAPGIRRALKAAGILCSEIGEVRAGPPAVRRRTASGEEEIPCPERDEIARAFEG